MNLFRGFSSLFCLCCFIGVVSAETQIAQEKSVIRIYHDADWSNSRESALSIWQGVQTALSEVDYQVQGHSLELIKKDHAGNVLLSKKNMLDFLADEHGLAIVSGIHSPPLIKYRSFINENKILTIVPWAAGSSITRYPSYENWIFRVSIDDAKAGGFLVDFAMNQKQCKIPYLLLENSPWGQSNLDSISQAMAELGFSRVQAARFDWGMKSFTARSKVIDIVEQGADCIILVSSATEGSVIAKVVAELPEAQRLPIISHWGITSGGFEKVINANVREKLDLSFIQSCFSFLDKPLPIEAENVLMQAMKLFPAELASPQDIRAPTGFIHGYDATKLLLAALNQVELVENMSVNRDNIRVALEELEAPVAGLIKTYNKPFGIYGIENQDAHEALGIGDYCMGQYGVSDEIILIKRSQ